MWKERFEDLPIASRPITRVYSDFKGSKASKVDTKSEEDFEPRPLRSMKTWATQDTFVSTGMNSLKKSRFDEFDFPGGRQEVRLNAGGRG